jgi:hypothetical protein
VQAQLQQHAAPSQAARAREERSDGVSRAMSSLRDSWRKVKSRLGSGGGSAVGVGGGGAGGGGGSD